MVSTTVSYRCEFECAYLINHELNAHRYRIEVTVDGPQRFEDLGQIIDYRVLGNYVKNAVPDGYWLVGSDATPQQTELAEYLCRCYVPVLHLSIKLSVESLCSYFATKLQEALDAHEPGVRVVEVKLRETNDSFAAWTLY